MEISSLYRSIIPMVSSSSFGNVFRCGTLKRRHYHNIPLAKGYVDTRPLSIITHWNTNKSVRYPSEPIEPSSHEVLGSGMILLRNYVGIKDQIDIVNICQKLGMGPGGFYKPAELQRYIMCLGRNWDPETGYKERYRRSDGSEPLPLTNELISLAETALQDAQTHLNGLPSMHPDTCLVNYYPTNGRSELHQDCDESHDSLIRGLPVVSVSVGQLALYVYGDTRDEKKSKEVIVQSGDVLIFGGKSRHVYHGVSQVAEYTCPGLIYDEIGLLPGHLSLTFRQF